MMGAPPHRIDILTQIAGVDFADVWASRSAKEVSGLQVPFIGLECLIENKRAAGRPRDLDDAERLERMISGAESDA